MLVAARSAPRREEIDQRDLARANRPCLNPGWLASRGGRSNWGAGLSIKHRRDQVRARTLPRPDGADRRKIPSARQTHKRHDDISSSARRLRRSSARARWRRGERHRGRADRVAESARGRADAMMPVRQRYDAAEDHHDGAEEQPRHQRIVVNVDDKSPLAARIAQNDIEIADEDWCGWRRSRAAAADW